MAFFKKGLKTVTFATCVWERDWRQILLDDQYLSKMQIENHCYDFQEKILIINNVQNYKPVIEAAEKKISEGVLTNFYLAKDHKNKILNFFQLDRKDFKKDESFDGSDDWIYYNALGPLAAIYFCATDYLLYHTGDAFLKKPVSWIEKAIGMLEKKRSYKVANLIWNNQLIEAQRESYKIRKDFLISKKGFSDQLFLIRRKDFQKPIYSLVTEEGSHFPRGDVFEKRVFCHMLKLGWKRITYTKGGYTHQNF